MSNIIIKRLELEVDAVARGVHEVVAVAHGVVGQDVEAICDDCGPTRSS